jgi:hypothetical protein
LIFGPQRQTPDDPWLELEDVSGIPVLKAPGWLEHFECRQGKCFACCDCHHLWRIIEAFVPWDSSFEGPGTQTPYWVLCVDCRPGLLGLRCPQCGGKNLIPAGFADWRYPRVHQRTEEPFWWSSLA